MAWKFDSLDVEQEMDETRFACRSLPAHSCLTPTPLDSQGVFTPSL
jgi:hypothetical protein